MCIRDRGNPVSVFDEGFTQFGTGYVGAIPLPVVLMAAVVVVGIFITQYTRFGRHIYAVGGNSKASQWSGISVDRIKTVSYTHLFRDKEEPTLTLNIGGIANVHLAYKDRRKMVAFDTGPGNLMSDNAARLSLIHICSLFLRFIASITAKTLKPSTRSACIWSGLMPAPARARMP